MKIKEVIVVEGKNDTNVLKSYLQCDTLETSGTHLGKEVLARIAQLQKTRGIIIFTDPDFPGEKIRTTINQYVPGCKNAFIDKNKAKTTKKVGIEHANKEDIIEALSNLLTYDDTFIETLSYEDFMNLGLQGQKDSGQKRDILAQKLSLGKPNAKTLWKRLNMGRYKKEDIEDLLK
ncbi:MAG: ribonuclease M5 [Longicatena sp.]